jgi:cytoskeletal protein CcmA (bactofilin family)
MFAFTNSAEKVSPTVVGAGSRFIGDIKTDGIVQIHGLVQGTISGNTVIIARGGRVIGRVNAKSLFLHGMMDGPATVDSVNVFADAQMTGALSYTNLNINNNNGLECKLVCRKPGK